MAIVCAMSSRPPYRLLEVVGGPGARLRLLVLRLVFRSTGWRTYRVVERVARLLPRHARAAGVVQVPGGRLEVPLDDTYWLRLLLEPQRPYEPELADVLAELEPTSVFVDCGANVGFWSLAASAVLDDGRIVAVEASQTTHARLLANRDRSGRTFRCERKAVYSTADDTLQLLTPQDEHAGAHVDAVYGSSVRPTASSEAVTTTTIDELVALLPDERTSVFVKLDVEGAEEQALRGAVQTLAREPVVLVYEDHGSDPDSRVTAFVLGELGLSVAVSDGRHGWRPVRQASDLRLVKVDPLRGYNCVATNTAAWTARFESATVVS